MVCLGRLGTGLICLVAIGALTACSGGDAEGDGRGPSGRPMPSDDVTGDGDGDSMTPTDFGGGPGSSPNLGEPPPVPPPPTIDMSAPDWAQDDTGMSGLDQGTIDTLKGGGGSCSTNVTFPYNGTMFPGALEPPIIMWDSGGESAYVKFEYEQSTKVSYEYAAAVANPAELQIPRDAWNEITRRTNNASLNVTLSVMSGGNVSTCQLNWRVAPGNMTGALYYNTYQAPAPGVQGQGAIMRLPLGSTYEIYKQDTAALPNVPTGPCYSCHSLSFDGSTMVASYHDYLTKVFEVEKYDVGQDVQPAASGNIHNANFGALTPDGTRILAMGNPECTQNSDTFPRKPNNFPLVEGADVAKMLDTSDGTDTGAAGLDAANYMWMPQFSPDGDKVVFNHAKDNGAGGTDRTQLAVMDYDYESNTFSNLRVIVDTAQMSVPAPTVDYVPFTTLAGPVPNGIDMCTAPLEPNASLGVLLGGSCTGPCYPSWPFFTPDGKGVVFSLMSDPDFAQAFPGRDAPSKADLWYVDTETFEVVRLDNANKGLKTIDEENNYYPTVMPVAVGGYFWMFWTAVRDYGHKSHGRVEGALPNSVADAEKKRIWVSAIKPRIEIEAEVVAEPGPLTDPSFPGFYLPGQSESGNVRAFAALNPCLPDLSECATGLDCCCGFCTIIDNAPMGQCCLEIPECAKTNEKCETDDDCCPPEAPDEPQNKCLGGFCGFIALE